MKIEQPALITCQITNLPRLGRCKGCDCPEIETVTAEMVQDARRRSDEASEAGNTVAAILWLKIEIAMSRRIKPNTTTQVGP
jgi:hypothetical protein